MTEEEVIHQAQVRTARKFDIPLWVVEVNHICLEKDAEQFHLYCQ